MNHFLLLHDSLPITEKRQISPKLHGLYHHPIENFVRAYSLDNQRLLVFFAFNFSFFLLFTLLFTDTLAIIFSDAAVTTGQQAV